MFRIEQCALLTKDGRDLSHTRHTARRTELYLIKGLDSDAAHVRLMADESLRHRVPDHGLEAT